LRTFRGEQSILVLRYIHAVFLESLNEMIDLHGERLAAFRNRVPFSIYLVLFVSSAITL